MENELPEGWVEATISQMVSANGIFNDGDWVESKDQDENGDVRLIQLADVGIGKFRNKSARFLTSKKAVELNCTFLDKGDILIARMPDPLGRACIFPLTGKNVTVVDIAIVRCGTNGVDNQWLMYALNSPSIQRQISELSSGSTRLRISRKNLSTILFPLPPLAEQKRIVAKLDAAFGHLETLKTSLNRIPELLKKFRQNVLTQAVTGKLTEDWREGKELNNSLDLLNKLKLIQEQLIKSKIVRDIAINTHDRLNNFSDLPESWVITDLLNLSKIIDPNPTHRMPNYVSEGSPFISTENIVNENTLNLKIGKKVTDETVKEQIKRFEIKSGDFLFTRIGTIGKVCNLPLVRNYALSHAVCIISSYSEELCLPAYLKIALKSQKVLQQGIEGVKSVGVPDLGMGKVRAFQIPFPSKQEQQEIVKRVEALLSQADALEAQYESLKAKIEKLPQALLSKAFRGELVPQDPTDEPASVLLQKIKAEAAKGGKKKSATGQIAFEFAEE